MYKTEGDAKTTSFPGSSLPPSREEERTLGTREEEKGPWERG